jgi:hypothetical protein
MFGTYMGKCSVAPIAESNHPMYRDHLPFGEIGSVGHRQELSVSIGVLGVGDMATAGEKPSSFLD